MAHVRLLVGPMWSGKTFILTDYLRQYLDHHLRVAVFDHPRNDRNSARDLSYIFPRAKKLDAVSDVSDYHLVVFDEVHLYEVFQNTDSLLKTIETASNSALVLCAGIYYDFYAGYDVFEVWRKLQKRGAVMNLLNSRKPCSACGQRENVWYTANDGSTSARVGDHYINVCDRCKDTCLAQYRSLCDKEAV